VKDEIYDGQYKPDVTSQQPLRDPRKLSIIWPEQPPDGYFQVFVGLPIKLSPIVQQTSTASTRDLWPAVTLHTYLQGDFERLDTVEKNNIFKLYDAEPDFLIDFRDKLAQRRWIESGTEVRFFNSHTIQLLKIVTGPCGSPQE